MAQDRVRRETPPRPACSLASSELLYNIVFQRALEVCCSETFHRFQSDLRCVLVKFDFGFCIHDSRRHGGYRFISLRVDLRVRPASRRDGETHLAHLEYDHFPPSTVPFRSVPLARLEHMRIYIRFT